MKTRLLGGALMAFFALSCTARTPQDAVQEWSIVDMSREPTEVTLPQGLWELIEKAHVGLHALSFDPSRELEGKGPVQFYTSMPLTVELTSPESQVLKHEAYRLVYPDGGGTLDLARFLQPASAGALQLSFNFPPEHASASRKVFFLSNSPVREIDGRSMGSGCQVYLDVTELFETSMEKGGFTLFLKDHRHLTVYGGTFFLVSSEASQLFLAHLKITDSRYPDFFCRNEQPSA